jgi:AcrR family transcriptional regulator
MLSECTIFLMGKSGTPRAVARNAQIEAIKGVARRLLAEKGVSGLSLREVAREMDLVSSALYRYFATRDELLTALIVDAYDELGSSCEIADAGQRHDDYYGRWTASAKAIRSWAKAQPHEYTLIFGTPILGYEAPPETVKSAARVAHVLGTIFHDARESGKAVKPLVDGIGDVNDFLEVETLSSVMPGVSTDDYVRALMAWTQIFGFISFEMFGHYEGSVKNADMMFDRVLYELAQSLDISHS